MLASLQHLRDRDPMATVTSDLLAVQSDRFIVKVTVQTQSLGIATALAADAVIEVAEDRALQRALRNLGITGTEPLETPLSTLAVGAMPTTPSQITASASVDMLDNSILKVTDPRITDPAIGQPSALPTATQKTDTTPQPFPEPTPTNITPTPLNGESVSFPMEALPTNLPAPINLSDVIAQTDVELRRLNWSVTDGREYLTNTYGKRSRHDLTDEELLAFLLHLEALPTPPTSV